MRAAAKALKTSAMSFKFRPDWETACAEYEKAVTCFKVAKDMQRAIDASVKASEAHTHLDNKMYMSAKHLETAAFFARDLKRPDEAARLYEEAASFHQMDGEYGAAAEDLAKGGKALEGHDDARGGALMVAACENIDQIEEEGKLGMSVDVYKQAVSYMLRTAQLGAAATLLHKQMPVHHRLQQPHGVARAALSLVVVGLADDDFDGAEAAHHSALERGDGYAGSDEAGVGGKLLQGYTSQSEEALAVAVSSHLLAHLENQVTRTAKSLTLRSAGVPMHKIDRGGGGSGGSGGLTSSGGSGGGGAGTGSAGAGAGVLPLAGTGDFGEVAPEDELDDDDLT